MGISDLLAWVHTFVDSHPDREARDATCFAFIGTPTIMIMKPLCPNVCSKLHKMAFCSTLITAVSTKKTYPDHSVCFFPGKNKFPVYTVAHIKKIK